MSEQSPSPDPKGTVSHLPCYLIAQIPSLCYKYESLTIPYSPVSKKYVFPFYFLSSLREFPSLLSLISLILVYHQWISCIAPLTSPPLVKMYKISYKTAILESIFSFNWEFASQQLSSFWLKQTLIIRLFLRLDVLSLTLLTTSFCSFCSKETLFCRRRPWPSKFSTKSMMSDSNKVKWTSNDCHHYLAWPCKHKDILKRPSRVSRDKRKT